jgi:hypothetical protein
VCVCVCVWQEQNETGILASKVMIYTMTRGRRVRRYGTVLRHVIQDVPEIQCTICAVGDLVKEGQ